MAAVGRKVARLGELSPMSRGGQRRNRRQQPLEHGQFAEQLLLRGVDDRLQRSLQSVVDTAKEELLIEVPVLQRLLAPIPPLAALA